MKAILSAFVFTVVNALWFNSGGISASNQHPYTLPAQPEQPDTITTVKEAGVKDLSALSSEEFTQFSHPFFPYHSARIKRITGFCEQNANAYSGYIDIGDKHIFFYFFESRNDPDSDDVLFWTNGGPGGSSTMALFNELGPCNIVSPNETEHNPYSWTSNANMFFIDQPIGVGFSYSDTGRVPASTEESAKDIAGFVAMFFEIFEKFKGRGFHLTGESYGGRYLPVYAAEIYDQNARLTQAGLTPVNLKSVLIGNPAVDPFERYPSLYDLQCTELPSRASQSIETCVRMKKAIPRCAKWLTKSCIDSWDYMNCDAAREFCDVELLQPFLSLGTNIYDTRKECDMKNLNGMQCYHEFSWIEKYLNQEGIRRQIGADPQAGAFHIASDLIGLSFYDSGDHLHQNQVYLAELLHRGVAVIIYTGDADLICNWLANERWTLKMQWTGHDDYVVQPLRDWYVDGHVAGRVRSSGNFTYARVHGGGHLLPYDRPVESLELLNQWLSGRRLL